MISALDWLKRHRFYMVPLTPSHAEQAKRCLADLRREIGVLESDLDKAEVSSFLRIAEQADALKTLAMRALRDHGYIQGS